MMGFPRMIAAAILAAGAWCLGPGPVVAADRAERPLVLAHYMPWFVAKPASPAWGWHWTMNAYDPEKVQDGKRAIASHYYPLIGPYDSGDPVVVEYHLLLMKLAGFDGLIVDWYGLDDRFDHPIIHRNTAALFPAAAKVGLKVAICVEDRTIVDLAEAGLIPKGDRAEYLNGTLRWLQKNWFAEPNYLKLGGKPVLLSFGADGLTDAEWKEAMPTGADASIYLSEHRRRPVAAGAFDWPIPKEGLASLDRFAETSRDWPVRMPVAFPRFRDIYAEAKIHPSFGSIPDDEGRTFAATLKRGLTGGAPLVQVATWNDWGEGTAIEPSTEFQFRDLEAAQRLRRDLLDPEFVAGGRSLRLAHRLYLLRRKLAQRPETNRLLDPVPADLIQGRLDRAEWVMTMTESL